MWKKDTDSLPEVVKTNNNVTEHKTIIITNVSNTHTS